MSIYVEIQICGSMDDLWLKTQSPDLHERWDLRFSEIEYLPKVIESSPQQFRYTTRIGFGITVYGEGESVGNRDASDGSRTSSLKFWSNDPKSLIHEGAGYWQYVPTDDGIRFLTSYDYRVRGGFIGQAFDTLIFRPLIGWATAWSFDRLRLWIENNINPATSLQRTLLHALATSMVAFVWIYQGAAPKLLGQHADELTMLRDIGLSPAAAPAVLQFLGWSEVAAGLLVVAFSSKRWPFMMTIVLMLLATFGIAWHSPHYLWAAFNPITLNLLMIGMSIVALASIRDRPSARRCLRTAPEKSP
jgi:uncharacterized membrane protein YphA (DoxX/SURF4 family)